ncbi:MAG: DUF285 domain-containing protein [Clostridiales bacterium]|nr:DUF285 domain-containing protein [Clostridiales bacterium]
MKKRILSLFLTVLIMLVLIPTVSAQTGGSELAEWNHTVDEEAGTVILTKYIGDADSVTVPASFDVQGQVYGTVLATTTVFRANTGLKSISISEGVRFLNNSMRMLFGDCTALTNVDLSAVDTSDVVSLSYLFYNCSALKAVDLSSFDTGSVTEIYAMFSGCTRLSGLTGYENWNTSSLKIMSFAFNKFANSLSASVHVTIDLSHWDLSNLSASAWCFQNCRAQQILLPDNLAIMSAGFLNHATRYEGTSFTVPAGVKKIGYAHTLYDFATDDLIEIRVAEGNTNYIAIDGILYSADGKEMLAVPRNKPFENGVFEIPEGVDFLGELSFSRNYNIHTVLLPDTYEIEYVPLYDDRYIVYADTGNLNAGTNLSIAIYCYTGITDYAVKDTNPRYSFADGIIYSKDMKHMVAVPARYNKVMDIPEGVTSWDVEAMWADGSSTVDNLLANCAGVNIPATMKEIADDQLTMLNRLYSNRKDTSNPFTITVAEGNKFFRLDETGLIYDEQETEPPELILPEGSETVVDEERCQIYGIDTGMSIEAFEAMFNVSRDGYTSVITSGRYVGTGSVLTVHDSHGEVIKEYTVVIFGDLDGNGRVTAADISVAQYGLVNGFEDEVFEFAANIVKLSKRDRFNAQDVSALYSAIAGEPIDQAALAQTYEYYGW